MILTKLTNSNCDKTQIVTKLKISNLKKKLKNSNGDQIQLLKLKGKNQQIKLRKN